MIFFTINRNAPMLITRKLLQTFALFLCSLFTVADLLAMGMGNDTDDFYGGMNYKKIFDQTSIFAKREFKETLVAEGLPLPAAPQQPAKPDGVVAKISKFLMLKQLRELMDWRFDQNKRLAAPVKTSQDLDAALLADFRLKKAMAMKRALYQPIFSSGIDMAVFGAAPRLVNMGEVGGGISNFALVHVIGENIKRLSRAMYSIYVSPLSDPLDDYEQIYAVKKRFLPESLQEKIENKFAAARQNSQVVDTVLSFCQVALSLPVKSSLPAQQMFKEPLPRIESRIMRHLRERGHDLATSQALAAPLLQHMVRSATGPGVLKSPKPVVYLQGPPGTGKSYTAEEMARLLGVKLIKIQVTSSEAAALVGDDTQPGQLLEALTHQGADGENDAVILIDEIDRIVNNNDESVLATILPLLEPTATSFYSPYLKAEVDLSRFCFVLCGNAALKSKALQSRVSTIVFDPMSKQRKRDLVYGYLVPELCKSARPEFNLNPKGLTRSECEAIQRLIDADSDQGIRTLQLKVAQLINQFRIERARQADVGGAVTGQVSRNRAGSGRVDKSRAGKS